MDVKLFHHEDYLSGLNSHIPLKDKLAQVHKLIQDDLPFVARIAMVIYDPDTRMLKTFLESNSDQSQPSKLANFEAPIDQSKSLMKMMNEGRARVINTISEMTDITLEHTQRILAEGYVSSYTKPLYKRGDFVGFLFFNSKQTDVFDPAALRQLDIFGYMVSLMIFSELSMLKTMTAAMKTSSKLANLRDPETGAHLERMSRYSRLIAKTIAPKHHLSDEYVERIFMFSPLHDIGKIAIPDHILMKPGKLDPDEMEIMKTHATIGRQITDELIKDFRLCRLNNIDIVRNIVEYHHETLDGEGYPKGLTAEQIPLEAKIVAVADIFDALTSHRPYKEAWTNEQAFTLLKELAGKKLDQDCVDALLDNSSAVEEIQRLFEEDCC